MLEGFKKFIMRGNVMELAVAVIIGGAFTAIVTAFTKGIVEPVLALFGGSPEFGLGFHLREGNPATFVNLGSILTAIVNFLIIAAVVYFGIVAPINALTERAKRRQGVDPEEPAPTTEQLLSDIRDLLAAQNAATTSTGSAEASTTGTGTTPPTTK